MTQRPAFAAREGRNVYGDTYVSGAGHVHLGDVYVNQPESGEDIRENKNKARAGM